MNLQSQISALNCNLNKIFIQFVECHGQDSGIGGILTFSGLSLKKNLIMSSALNFHSFPPTPQTTSAQISWSVPVRIRGGRVYAYEFVHWSQLLYKAMWYSIRYIASVIININNKLICSVLILKSFVNENRRDQP